MQRIASIEKIASLIPVRRTYAATGSALINKGRLNYTLPSNQRVVVAFPWLLGFIVGDGCFNFFSPDLSMPKFSKSSRFFILEDTGSPGLGPGPRVSSNNYESVIFLCPVRRTATG